MMQRPHLLLWLVLALSVMTAATADETKIGKLDGERVFKEYKLYQQLNDELQALGRKLITQYDERKRKYPLLLDEEWNQLVDLRQRRTTLSPNEKLNLERMEKLSDERDRELAELEGQQQLNDKQNERWKELQRLRAQAAQMLRDQWERIQRQGEERAREIETKLTAEIRSAVEEVAKEQGLSVVLQAEVVVFGGIDITDATVKKLNERPTPAGVTVPAAGGAEGGGGN